jgi:hypothetical protein
MPMFLDRHPTMPIPPEMMEAMKKDIGVRGADGVTQLQFIMGANESYCLTEAESAEAVHAHHEALGITVGEGHVEEVSASLP